MNTKELAFEKMNQELSLAHHQAIDTLHNLICQDGDEELFQGLLKEEKTLQGAYAFMHEYARKHQTSNSYGMDGTLALSLVRDYLNETETTPDVQPPKIESKASAYKLPKNVTGEGVVDAPKPTKAKSPKPKDDVNMSIFDFMDDDDESEETES